MRATEFEMGRPVAPEIGVRNPRTGQIDHWITASTADDIACVAARLRDAQSGWAAAPIEYRIEVLERWADAIDTAAGRIGDAECRDTGRYRLSHEVPFMVSGIVRAWCRIAPAVLNSARLSGSLTLAPTVDFQTQLVPYPLLGVISPWNPPFCFPRATRSPHCSPAAPRS